MRKDVLLYGTAPLCKNEFVCVQLDDATGSHLRVWKRSIMLGDVSWGWIKWFGWVELRFGGQTKLAEENVVLGENPLATLQ